MRRFPFYAYPNPPHSFSYPVEAPSYHHPHRPFSDLSSVPTPRPTPTRRSVINVPVFDSVASRPSSSPPSQPLPHAVRPPSINDASSAATTIQSHFRGFCVRRHHPLLHLRSIAKARNQLEELQAELEKPEFALKVRKSENERLRFSESVMAIILRLDAIEGSIAEVRSQRKEATKMAIKLQDAIDAIMMQKDEIAAVDSTTDGTAPRDEPVQPQEPHFPEVNMVQGEAYTVSAGGVTDVNAMQEKPLTSEVDVAEKCMAHGDNNDVMDMVPESVSLLHPCEVEDLDQQSEAGSGHFTEQDMSHVAKENADNDATTHANEEEVNNAIDALHLEALKSHMPNHFLVAKDTSVDDMIDVGDGTAETESTDGSYTCMDVVQEDKKGISQDVELCPGTPTAEEKCDASPGNELQDPLTSFERLTEGNCYLDCSSSPTLHKHERSDEANENRSTEAYSCDEEKAQAFTPAMSGAPSSHVDAILHQLSEDCRQLKSLVGKLLMQNKAQSNVLCVLGERLELLEHQQQLNRQHKQQKMREKRKLKKGSKRSVKCRNCE